MGEYLLGIDCGATVTKAVIFDLAGRELCSASQTAEASYPHPGHVERDTARLWQSAATAVRGALEAAGVAGAEVVAVGVCGHGNGLYPLDRQGEPLGPGILSMDTRAAAIVAGWEAQGLPERLWPQILQSPYAAQPPALLRWLKQHQPERYRRVGAVLLAKDVVVARLCGTLGSDTTDMGATGLLDLRQRAYAPELLDAYGIAEIAGALPPLRESAELAGHVTREAAQATGLLAGTPVVAGMFDVTAGALGAGATKPGQACLIAGTWSINAVVTEAPLAQRDLFLNSAYTPGRWLAVDASATSCTNLEWFVTHCCGEERAEAQARGVSVYDLCAEQVGRLAPHEPTPIFHPFLFGSNVQASARAGFYGIAGWHTKAHLLRALFEGVVYGHQSHVEKLRAAGAEIAAARFIGGGARSAVWSQIFADALGLELEVPAGSQIGARGAALCAGIGAGVYDDYADAAARAVTIERRHRPDPQAAPVYHERYAAYRQLLDVMRAPWDQLDRLGA
ncbi:MAG: FGGY-family carbohydrate kinase [Roseiflexaceae bacterium]